MWQSQSVARGGDRLPGLTITLAVAAVFLGQGSTAAQGPATPATPATPTAPPASPPGNDLSTRYRFLERYSPTEEKPRPELVGQYRVAIRETVREVIENLRGAPDRRETTARIIYTERPARLSDLATVSAAVRRYETFRLPTDPKTKPAAAPPLEGLTLWYQIRPGDDPLILSLTEDRRLRDVEYGIISRQVFLPELAAGLLPHLPHRIGDPWSLSPVAVKALIGERPPRGQTLRATLAEIRAVPKTNQMTAVINVAGQVGQTANQVSVNGQILFAFTLPSSTAGEPNGAKAEDDGAVEAWGAITEVRLTVSRTNAIPGAGRLRQVRTSEIVLARQLETPNVPPLAIPEPAPTPNELNSWLTFTDPRGRFHFQHPQDFRPPLQPEKDYVELVDPQPVADDVVAIEVIGKTGDRRTDALGRDPEYHLKNLKDLWLKDRIDAIPGFKGWLPDAEWAASKMKVYRIEVVLKQPKAGVKGGITRIHADYYVALLSRDETLFVSATTLKDPPAAFRAQAEAILKTFRMDGPEPAK